MLQNYKTDLRKQKVKETPTCSLPCMLINDQEMPNPYIGYKANDTFITKYKVLSKIADVLAQWTDL